MYSEPDLHSKLACLLCSESEFIFVSVRDTVLFGPQMFENQRDTHRRISENLSIRHVQIQVEIVVQRCSNAWPAGTKM